MFDSAIKHMLFDALNHPGTRLFLMAGISHTTSYPKIDSITRLCNKCYAIGLFAYSPRHLGRAVRGVGGQGSAPPVETYPHAKMVISLLTLPFFPCTD